MRFEEPTWDFLDLDAGAADPLTTSNVEVEG